MVNTVALAGNITRDAELRRTKSGTAVLSFSIAVNARRKDGDGGWVDEANFFDLAMFGPRAEAIAQYLVKGAKVAVTGRLHQSRWQGDDGKNRSKVSVYVDDLDFMGGRPRDGQGGVDPYDEDMPF